MPLGYGAGFKIRVVMMASKTPGSRNAGFWQASDISVSSEACLRCSPGFGGLIRNYFLLFNRPVRNLMA